MKALSLAILLGIVAPAHAAPSDAYCHTCPPASRRMLSKDERTGKITCKKGTELAVDAKQRLVFCTTAKAIDVDGVAVAAGAYTLFHPNGRVYQTAVRAPFEAVLADQTTVMCAANHVVLDEHGRLLYCRLGARRAGTPQARVGEGISFHADGRVAGMTLDEPFTAAGIHLPPGASVSWNDRGVVIGGGSGSPIAASGLSIINEFRLHPNGRLQSCMLATPGTLQGHAFPAAAKLSLRADGSLERAEYIQDGGFMIHGEHWTDTLHLTFDATGKITSSHVTRWQSDVGHHPKFGP